MDDLLKTAAETLLMKKQALVFCPNRASAEKTAEDIAKLSKEYFPELEQEILHALNSPTTQCRKLSQAIRKGIAFHHAGLVQKQRELIEDNFRDGKIKIICATPTLAAGLSMPAFRVIIKSLKRYSGRWGMDWIPVLEYLQMAGRAGRPEYEKFGESIVIAKNEGEKEEIHQRYVRGEPEEIYSKLAVEPVLRTYLLALIASGVIRDTSSMRAFFTKTFWAHQFQDLEKLEEIMLRMLNLLEEWELIILSEGTKKEDFVPASSLESASDTKMRATLLGKRVSELYLDPLTARHFLDCLQNFSKDKIPWSILQMISHTLEMRPLLRIRAKEEQHIQENLMKNYTFLLKPEPKVFDSEYEEFLNSIKTTMYFESWINEHEEEFLLEQYDIRPGEIRYKNEAADWLLYASQELAQLCDYKHAVKEIHKLRLRVKNGVKEELLPLLKLQGVGRIRARKLYSYGLHDLGDIKRIDEATLAQLVGKAVAESIKKQVGQEVQEIPKGTRKGQLSLEKY